MPYCVLDVSVIVDLDHSGLLADVFSLSLQFTIPDALFDSEILDLESLTKPDLVNLGLRIETLPGDVVSEAARLQSLDRRLSLNDCFAAALALHEHRILLTGDRRLRVLAERERLEVHGVLWLIDRLAEAGAVRSDRLISALEIMLARYALAVSRSRVIRK